MAAFLPEKHKKHLLSCLKLLPEAYEQLDTTRLTILFFCLSGLDVLNALDSLESEKARIVDWIYSLQITTKLGVEPGRCGFRCGFAGAPDAKVCDGTSSGLDCGHLAMTYSALCCLLILDDDFSRLDTLGLVSGLRACQLEDGSFSACCAGTENDTRFIYCAAVISYMLNDWRGFQTVKALDFIGKSQNYDGGIGQGPGFESHGGSSFCGLATTMLTGTKSVDERRLRSWCLWRQTNGFHGRANKPDDSCYSFWIPACLHMLNSLDLLDVEKAREFTLSTQDTVVGGFGKYADCHPDVLHTYLSLAGLSLLGQPGLEPLDPVLNITVRSATRLKRIHASKPNFMGSKTPCCTES